METYALKRLLCACIMNADRYCPELAGCVELRAATNRITALLWNEAYCRLYADQDRRSALLDMRDRPVLYDR